MRHLPTAILALLVGLSSLSPVEDMSPLARGPAIADHVVLISIDGLRPDAIETGRAEAMRSLMRRGAHATRAETIRPSITLPSHASMLTGLDYARHGVGWNSYRPGHIDRPTVFSMARRAGLSSATLLGKGSLYYLANPEHVDWIHGPFGSALRSRSGVWLPSVAPSPNEGGEGGEGAAPRARAEDLAAVFAAEWPRQRPALTFVHLRDPDVVGHHEGWMSPAYLEAVRAADQAVGVMVQTIARAGVAGTTAVLVTADHGGTTGLRRHYDRDEPDRLENVRIPWVWVGPGVPPGLVIDRMVRTYDTAPTALAFLGVPPPLGIDGHAVDEVLRPSPLSRRARAGATVQARHAAPIHSEAAVTGR